MLKLQICLCKQIMRPAACPSPSIKLVSLILRTAELNSISGLTGGELDREEGQSRGRV